MEKTLDNTTAEQALKQVSDIKFWGDGNTFKLISKASSKQEGWMKSTKAMEIENVGCVVQVTTQNYDNVSEAVTFVPGVKIEEYFILGVKMEDGKEVEAKIPARRLVSLGFHYGQEPKKIK